MVLKFLAIRNPRSMTPSNKGLVSRDNSLLTLSTALTTYCPIRIFVSLLIILTVSSAMKPVTEFTLIILSVPGLVSVLAVRWVRGPGLKFMLIVSGAAGSPKMPSWNAAIGFVPLGTARPAILISLSIYEMDARTSL